MKHFYVLALLCLSFTYAQETAVIDWINKNAITIEDADQETPLTNLKTNGSDMFKNVRLFGFGEATHYTKEFFDLKAKFFKYLVENEGVTIFMLEDIYYGVAEINTFLEGGEGDTRQLTGNLGFTIWHNEEVMNLIQWMRNYNTGKPAEKQVKFYSIDCQSGFNTNKVIKRFIAKYSIKTEDGISTVLDSCAMLSSYSKKKDKTKLDGYIKKLETLKTDLSNFSPKNADELRDATEASYALTVLQKFLNFLLQPNPDYRDKVMADNVSWILQHNGESSKGFIWAHNAHIAKHGDKFYRMGIHLKEKYGDAYYSMGFSYAKGKLIGMTKKNDEIVWVAYDLDKPVKNTYAEIFNKADASLYAIDFKKALQNPAMNTFLNSNLRIMDEGSGGHFPGYKGKKEKLGQIYDGIIFVRDVSVPVYLKDKVPASMIIN